MMNQELDRSGSGNFTDGKKQFSIRILFKHPFKSMHNDFFFPAVRTSRHNDWAGTGKTKFLSQLLFFLFRYFCIGLIIFGIAYNGNSFWPGPHFNDVSCIMS